VISVKLGLLVRPLVSIGYNHKSRMHALWWNSLHGVK